MKTEIILIILSFSIFIVADGKSLFPFLSFSAEGRSENQESRIKEFQTGGKISKIDPRKPIWLKDISNQKQGSKGNQIFRKITESRKTLIKGNNKSPLPVVSELSRNQTSVKLTKSCHFDKTEKCTNLEWLEFWNSIMAGSNSTPQPVGSNKTPMIEKESQNQENQAKTTELTNDQMAKSNFIQISSKTEKESINLHSKVPSELTRDKIPTVKICHFDKFERCTREDWYKFIKELKKERERKLQLIGSGSELTKDQKATGKICNYEKLERCTRKEWYEFLKGNNGLNWQLSKSQLL